jgi:hypothetical protein
MWKLSLSGVVELGEHFLASGIRFHAAVLALCFCPSRPMERVFGQIFRLIVA